MTVGYWLLLAVIVLAVVCSAVVAAMCEQALRRQETPYDRLDDYLDDLSEFRERGSSDASACVLDGPLSREAGQSERSPRELRPSAAAAPSSTARRPAPGEHASLPEHPVSRPSP